MTDSTSPKPRISMINFNTKPKPDEVEEAIPPKHSSISFGETQTKSGSSSKIAFGEHSKEKHPLSVKPSDIFHTISDDIAEEATRNVTSKYPKYSINFDMIKGLAKALACSDAQKVSEWGENSLILQKQLVTSTFTRIKEFNAMNGSELLTEVLEYGKNPQKDTSFFKRLTGKAQSIENYTTKVAALKQYTKTVLPILLNYKKSIDDNGLPLDLAILIEVEDLIKNKDTLLEDAFYNRRILLNGALQNLQMLNAQLEQTINLMTNMINEISHIMDVVIPAIQMKS